MKSCDLFTKLRKIYLGVGVSWLVVLIVLSLLMWESRGGTWGVVPFLLMTPLFQSMVFLLRGLKDTFVHTVQVMDSGEMEELRSELRVGRLQVGRPRGRPFNSKLICRTQVRGSICW